MCLSTMSKKNIQENKIVLNKVFVDIPILKSLDKIFSSDVGAFIVKKNKMNLVRSLDNVSLDIKMGDRVGLVGLNGSGKTTLLKCFAGIYPPTSGIIKIYGETLPLINISAGFQNEISGLDNIYLRGYFLGYKKSLIDHNLQKIINFSGLGDFIQLPIKTYSQGMKSRLSLSIIMIKKPDILLLDENLSTGDQKFLKSSNINLSNFIDSANVVVYASHNLNFLLERCNKLIWMNRGKLRMYDDAKKVGKSYRLFI